MRLLSIAGLWTALGLAIGYAEPAYSVIIETVWVGDPGNPGDTRYPNGGIPSFGSVGYAFGIGKYEVTAGQYVEFLNAVAGVDTYELYAFNMSNPWDGSGITRSGSGTKKDPYSYLIAEDYIQRPVNYVSWGDAARFANWLHNGQPTGAQDLKTTEDGSYLLNGASTGPALTTVTRNLTATWVIPSEDEWYKSAYYDGDSASGSYWDYPTRSNTVPGYDLADFSGNNANHWSPGAPFPIAAPYYATVVGEFQNSSSHYGTFDQGGNLWEWNEAVLFGASRNLRGGAFGLESFRMRASNRDGGIVPTQEYNKTGFRLSLVPEPSMGVPLVLASTIALRRRRLRLVRESILTPVPETPLPIS